MKTIEIILLCIIALIISVIIYNTNCHVITPTGFNLTNYMCWHNWIYIVVAASPIINPSINNIIASTSIIPYINPAVAANLKGPLKSL